MSALFYRGDIVVSLETQITNTGKNPLKPGDICKIYGMDSGHEIWFIGDGNGSYSKGKFRSATKLEIEYFNKGVKNIYGIPTIDHLVQGTWYKTIGSQFTTNKYIKFFRIDDYGKIVFSERITHKDEHHVYKSECMYQRSSIANPTQSLVPVSDEEVFPLLNKLVNNFSLY